MQDQSYEHERFQGESFESAKLSKRHYYDCVFEQVNFQFTILAQCHFENCTFRSCNASMMKLQNTRFTNAVFEGCKLLGVNFSGVGNFFSASFSRCNMDQTAFSGLKLNKFTFRDCSLREAFFSKNFMRHTVFDACDFEDCQFEFNNLAHADFRTSSNYFISAENNTFNQTRFALPEAVSLLKNFNIILD